MTDSGRLSRRDVAAAIAVVVLWGVHFPVVKIGVTALPPFLLTGLRFAAVALVLAPFCRPRRDQLAGIALLGSILGVGHFGLLFLGMSGMDSATTAIVVQLGVPFSVLTARIAFGERLGRVQGIGMVLAFSGAGLVAGEPSQPHLLPLMAVVAAAMAWAISNVVVKRLGQLDPLAMNGWVALSAAPQLLGLSLIFEHGQVEAMASAGWRGWSAFAYSVVFASLIAYTLWYRLLGRNPMNRVVPFTLLAPVIGVATAVAWLGEPLGWYRVVGGLLTIAGVAAIQLARPAPTPEPGA